MGKHTSAHICPFLRMCVTNEDLLRGTDLPGRRTVEQITSIELYLTVARRIVYPAP